MSKHFLNFHYVWSYSYPKWSRCHVEYRFGTKRTDLCSSSLRQNVNRQTFVWNSKLSKTIAIAIFFVYCRKKQRSSLQSEVQQKQTLYSKEHTTRKISLKNQKCNMMVWLTTNQFINQKIQGNSLILYLKKQVWNTYCILPKKDKENYCLTL